MTRPSTQSPSIHLEDWPLLEAAAREHGSIQAAVLAGLRALGAASVAPAEKEGVPGHVSAPEPPAGAEEATARPGGPEAELTAREAGALLGLKSSAVSGYIRSGRLPGRYDGEPSWGGWMTTRAAVEAYRNR